ncbi:MAG: fasciclin domain-containing protein [Bacteroidia bacterium]|jgi:uncharacterized surface protein with fasciclin (FAS1) repeats/plastocyanin|nr:fasciclin domain-containing protein [Bacteroidia bacterium]
MEFKNSFLMFLGVSLLSCGILKGQTTDCNADHKILITNFKFTPDSLNIKPGESVAFINIQGKHSILGDTSKTGASFNNPKGFELPLSTGETEGVCMGIVKFEIPGIHRFECGVGFNADLGMKGVINADAFTLKDLFLLDTIPESFLSRYALNNYLGSTLDSTLDLTVFLPDDDAVRKILDSLETSQFKGLGFVDLPKALKYQVVLGQLEYKDFRDSLLLPTLYGQNLLMTKKGDSFYVDGALISDTNFMADNGVAHLVNNILAPSGLPATSVWDIIYMEDSLQFFEDAVQTLGLKSTLRVQAELNENSNLAGPFTVLAPTNRAFKKLSDALNLTLSELKKSSIIGDLILGHLIEKRVETKNINNNQSSVTQNNKTITFNINGDTINVEGVRIIVKDLLAYNGVVHILEDVLPVYDIPDLVGNCGVWKLEIFDEDNNGWRGTQLFLEKNGNILTEKSLPTGGYNAFEFGVDSGDLINVITFSSYYNIGQSYRITDQQRGIQAESGNQSDQMVNSMGLRACIEKPSCGMVEIIMSDYLGQGWGLNFLDVDINNRFYLRIPFYSGERQVTKIPVNNGDELDFYYNLRSDMAEYNAYTIISPDGKKIVDQNSEFQIPKSVTDIIVCPSSSVFQDRYEKGELYPNPSSNVVYLPIDLKSAEIYAVDITGKKTNLSIKVDQAVNVSKLPSGIYYITVNKTGKYYQYPLVIQR